MDYGKLLSRSFEITRKYRVLWLFGILLALFGGGSGDGGNFGFPGASGNNPSRGGGTFPTLPRVDQNLVIAIIAIVACIGLVWFVAGIFFRFVSRGALIGLVQELEADQTDPTIRRGFKIGQERFWSLFGIALVVNIPLAIVSFALVAIAALPFLATFLPALAAGQGRLADRVNGLVIAGAAGSLFLFCCVILFLILVSLVLRPFYEFFVRTCVVEKRGALDSIREGFRIVRANFGNIAILYVLVIAIGIGFGVVMIPVALVLIGIPVVAGIVIYALANSIATGVIIGGIIAIPFFLLLIFISGLYHTFESTLWTEGYLAVTAK